MADFGERTGQLKKIEDFDFDNIRVTSVNGEPVNADGYTEAETIENAEDEIVTAQYHALHDRLEDFVLYLNSMGYLPSQALVGTDRIDLKDTDHAEQMFNLVEGYLDQVNEHEDEPALVQILRPDMSEFTSERPERTTYELNN